MLSLSAAGAQFCAKAVRVKPSGANTRVSINRAKLRPAAVSIARDKR